MFPHLKIRTLRLGNVPKVIELVNVRASTQALSCP